jgi:hypothetical protein
MSTSKGRGAAAWIAEVVPDNSACCSPPAPEPGDRVRPPTEPTDPRLFDEFEPAGRRDRRPRGAGELPAGYEHVFTTRSCRPGRTCPPRRCYLPAGVFHFAYLLVGSAPTSRRAWRRRKERTSTSAKRRSRQADPVRPGVARRTRRRRARIEISRNTFPTRRLPCLESSGSTSPGSPTGRQAERRPTSGETWRTTIFSVPAGSTADRRGVPMPSAAFSDVPAGAGRMAAGDCRSIRDRAARGGGNRRQEASMSARRQRLRDRPDVIRRGAIDKGEGPGGHRRALGVDAGGAAISPSGTRCARRNELSRRSAGDQGAVRIRGPTPASAGCGPSQAPSASGSARPMRRSPSRGARGPSPAHSDPGRSRRAGRRRGGEPPRPDVG